MSSNDYNLVDLKIKIKENNKSNDNIDPSYFTKTISIYKNNDETDDYETYQSSNFGRRKIDEINRFSDVVNLINKCNKIMVLSGAGVSVSAGIPDFRSKSGLYCMIKEKYNLNEPEAMFDMKHFIKNPDIFYSFANNICPGFDAKQCKYHPSPTHYFIKLLETKNKLLQNYTQNIDTLEIIAGINNVTQCHGSFATASCINCQYQIKGHYIKNHLSQNKIPLCPYCQRSKSDLNHLLNDNNNNNNNNLRKSQAILELFDAKNGKLKIRLPNIIGKNMNLLYKLCPLLFCHKDEILKINFYEEEQEISSQCYILEIIIRNNNNYRLLYKCMTSIMSSLRKMPSFGVIKPDIVFFGQDLPSCYHQTIEQHTKECDLLLVFGTSLAVMPVSMVPSKLNKNIPAILINREVPKQVIVDQFDVNLLGNCDDICHKLINELKWQSIQPNNHNPNNDNPNNDNAKDIKYQFIKPNFCVFPNGQLPKQENYDNQNNDDNETKIEDKEDINKECMECKEEIKISKLIFCTNMKGDIILKDCPNTICADCLWDRFDKNSACGSISKWVCDQCINVNHNHHNNNNNTNNRKKRSFKELNNDCSNDNHQQKSSSKKQKTVRFSV